MWVVRFIVDLLKALEVEGPMPNNIRMDENRAYSQIRMQCFSTWLSNYNHKKP